jgi:protocatechuate 3,4-dioxygenase, beta subunit
MKGKSMTGRPNNLALLARRQALAALAGLPVAGAVSAQTRPGSVRPTPRQTLGPFYPRSADERPRDTDADLLVVRGDRVLSRGVPLYLTGRVLDRAGAQVSDALVEIWQCDANAVYHHPAGGAEGERDPNFQGYGQTRTDADGAFHFRTIRPVPYPGRTAHIHVRVEGSGRPVLATQLYLVDEVENGRDFLYRQLSADERSQLTLALRPTESSHPLAQATRLSAAIELVLA